MQVELATDRVGVVPLTPRHVDATAELLAQAMDVDSAYRYLFPEPVARRTGLTELFARNLALHVRHRCTYIACDEAGSVLGTVTLRPPGGLGISTLTMLRHGLLPFGLRHGFDAVRRLVWLKQAYDAFEALAAAGEPHWYVHMMATAPALQGRGIGGALLDRALTLAGVRRSPRPAILTTHLTRNLAFYARENFETRWERTVEPPNGAPYTVWAMQRR